MSNSNPTNTTIQQTTTTTESTTLKSAVMNRIKQTFELMGADAAMAEFRQMAVMFSGCQDWPDINNLVMAFLLEMKQQTDKVAAEQAAKRDAALIDALATHGLNGNQINFLSGQAAQAPYYGAPTNEGGEH